MTNKTPSLSAPALAKLRASEIRYRRLFEAARDGILLLNVDTGQIEDVNPYLEELLGYSHVEFLGKKLWEVVAIADIEECRKMFAVIQQTGYVRYETQPFVSSAGMNIPVEFVSNSYESGGVMVIQCNIRDNAAHHQLVRQYKAIIDSSTDAIISKSLLGMIESWNLGAEKLFGYSAHEAVGRSIAFLLPLDHLDEEWDMLERMARGEKIDHFETTRRHKDGRLINISISISPVFNSNCQVIGVSNIARDLSARDRGEARRVSLEGQLRESQKMEAIGTLAGGIAHDLNNTIAAIMGNTELAIEDAAVRPAEAIASLIEIQKAARRSRALVQQILTFGRRQATTRMPITLHLVVSEAVALLRTTLPPRIDIGFFSAPDLPPVLADAVQIQQIVINLATNAMQALMGSPGSIDICIDTVAPDVSSAGTSGQLRALCDGHPAPLVRLTIRDSGAGMDAATKAHIFEPFFTTKPAGEGTGLGLSVVHGIVQSHDAVIEVESALGRGTTFVLYFPTTTAPVAVTTAVTTVAPSNKAAAAPGNGRQHILYIDDDEALVLLVTRLLERRGYHVSGYVNPRDALAALKAAPDSFALVVTDYNMPGMSGLDVGRQVRLMRADLPVVMVSGFIDENLVAKARASGMQTVTSKAIDAGDLCEAIVQQIAVPIAQQMALPMALLHQPTPSRRDSGLPPETSGNPPSPQAGIQAYARDTTQSHQAGLDDDLAAHPLDQTEHGLVEHDKASLQTALDTVSAENRDFRATHERLTEQLAALEQILNGMSDEIGNQARSLSMLADHSCTAATAAAAALSADVWDPLEMRRKSDIAVTATNATQRGAGDLTAYLLYMKGVLDARAVLPLQ